MLCIGGMIGSGIYLKPMAIATLLPSPTLVIAVWVAAGVLTLLGSLTYAGLGAKSPQHGGLYVYLRDTYGRLPAFLFGWSLLAVLETGSIAGLAAGVAQLAAGQWPLSAGSQMGLAAGLIVLLSVVNALSVKGGAWVQNLFTAVKSLGLVILILGGLLHHGAGHLSDTGLVPAGGALMAAFGAAMVKALWAYDGWINVTFVAGEVQNPQRNLPLALGVGTACVVAVYVGANLTYHAVLPLSLVQSTPSAGAAVSAVVFGVGAAGAMSLLMMASAFGTLNTSILTGSRVYYAMARDRMFWSRIAYVLPGARSPAASLALQAVWAIGLLTMWHTFDRITDNVIFIYWIFYALGAVTVFLNPDLRAWGYPYVPILFVLVSIWLAGNYVVQHPGDALQAAGLLAVGIALYPIWSRPRTVSSDTATVDGQV